LVTVKLYCGTVVALAATGWKSESIPGVGEVNLVHGSLKLDWVTVWFPARNMKAITSPLFAVTLPGVKVNVPFWETETLMVSAQTDAARPKREARATKRMAQTNRKKG